MKKDYFNIALMKDNNGVICINEKCDGIWNNIKSAIISNNRWSCTLSQIDSKIECKSACSILEINLGDGSFEFRREGIKVMKGESGALNTELGLELRLYNDYDMIEIIAIDKADLE